MSMSDDLSDSQRNQITELLTRGAKIEAIQFYREATGVGLKEAKDAVEAMEASLEPRPAGSRDPFAKKSGCFGVFAALITTMTVVVVVVMW